MKGRRPNPRLVKIHRNYTVAEIAERFGLHRHTVRRWIKNGLPTIDAKRPTLVLGRDLRDFLEERRTKNKRTCKPGEIYCVKCREPRSPAGGVAEYQPDESGSGNIVGTCSVCGCRIYRRVNVAKLDEVRGELELRFRRHRHT